VKNIFSIKNLAVALLLTTACGPAERQPLDSWVGLQKVYNTEEYNANILNANILNANILNANILNANILNANILNSAQATVTRTEALLANHVTFVGGVAASVTLGGAAINNVAVDDGMLTGVLSTDNTELGAASDFKGAVFKGRLSDSSDIDMRIDDVVYDSSYGLSWYKISMSVDYGYSWGPLCPAGGGAIALPNLWAANGQRVIDASLFTLACDGAALAKCFKWGYDLNARKVESDGLGNSKSQSLADWHQACTRLVTADYCGDGVSHTRTGTPIDIYDNLSIQTRDGSLGTTEADWAVDGGHCIRHTRWVDATGLGNDYDYVVAHCPSRLASSDVASCGTDPNQEPKVDLSSFPSANGYSVDTSVRSLLRNDSSGYLQ